MKLLRHLARLAAIPMLLGGIAAAISAAPPAASAAPLAAQDGWVRIVHLSPQAPAMDIYLYPFGDPAHPTVLRDVGYGDVSAYMALSPGQYTVAALGPDPGLRVEVLEDQMTTPRGKTLVRVVQASLKVNRVTVSYGSTLLTKQLTFGSVTAYMTVSPGVRTVKVTASRNHATLSLGLTANTVHTIVVLDGSSGLKADDLTDAVGTEAMPKGGTGTGLGGTALPPPADLAPWLLMMLAGALLTALGVVGLGWPRRTAVTRSP